MFTRTAPAYTAHTYTEVPNVHELHCSSSSSFAPTMGNFILPLACRCSEEQYTGSGHAVSLHFVRCGFWSAVCTCVFTLCQLLHCAWTNNEFVNFGRSTSYASSAVYYFSTIVPMPGAICHVAHYNSRIYACKSAPFQYFITVLMRDWKHIFDWNP